MKKNGEKTGQLEKVVSTLTIAMSNQKTVARSRKEKGSAEVEGDLRGQGDQVTTVAHTTSSSKSG